jgi:hypothetical protein
MVVYLRVTRWRLLWYYYSPLGIGMQVGQYFGTIYPLQLKKRLTFPKIIVAPEKFVHLAKQERVNIGI